MENTRLIKKYMNRKLYDVKTSSYVTLDDIRFFVESGEKVQVISNIDKSDITAMTLIQAITLQENRQVSNDKVDLLHDIIQTNGTFTSAIKSKSLPF